MMHNIEINIDDGFMSKLSARGRALGRDGVAVDCADDGTTPGGHAETFCESLLEAEL